MSAKMEQNHIMASNPAIFDRLSQKKGRTKTINYDTSLTKSRNYERQINAVYIVNNLNGHIQLLRTGNLLNIITTSIMIHTRVHN